MKTALMLGICKFLLAAKLFSQISEADMGTYFVEKLKERGVDAEAEVLYNSNGGAGEIKQGVADVYVYGVGGVSNHPYGIVQFILDDENVTLKLNGGERQEVIQGSNLERSVVEGNGGYFDVIEPVNSLSQLDSYISDVVSEFNSVNGVEGKVNENEKSFDLSQNYPNPFNSRTRVDYRLDEECDVSFKLYDVRGREVMDFSEGFQSAGKHSLDLNLLGLSNGVYILRGVFGDKSRSLKLNLEK